MTKRKNRFPPSATKRTSCIILDMKLCLPEHVSSDHLPTSALIFTLQIHHRSSRVLWHALYPLLFQTHWRIARRALGILLEECWQPWFLPRSNDDYQRNIETHALYEQQQQQNGTTTTQEANHHPSSQHQRLNRDTSYPPKNMTRRLQVPLTNNRATRTTKHIQPPVCQFSKDSVVFAAIFTIQPPTNTPLEYTFSGLLIRWEHLLIRAQSLSGYISTLGGGFFLCHHFSTAIQLARRQQRLAILLNDESMYYACWIHQAYSHIYAGKFGKANAILRQVWTAITSSSSHQNDYDTTSQSTKNTLLHKMCRSARLFSRRMHKASQSKLDQNTKDDVSKLLSETIDDLKRIRVVQDKSKADDLVIPFSRAVVRM